MQVVSLDFGPVGEADVTANLTEAVPCGPVMHDPAEQPGDAVELPFLHIKVPHHPADSEVLSKVLTRSHEDIPVVHVINQACSICWPSVLN